MSSNKFDPFGSGWNPDALVDELNTHADELIRRSSAKAKSNQYHADALEAAKRSKQVLVMAQEELARAAEDPRASFRAGWHLREALDLLAKWEYQRGKASNVTARAKRPRPSRRIENSEFWQRLSKLWTIYQKQVEDPRASHFTRWLIDNEDRVNDTRLSIDGNFLSLDEDANKGATLETIRKKIKKVSADLSR